MQSSAGLGAVLGSLGAVLGGLGAVWGENIRFSLVLRGFGTPRTGAATPLGRFFKGLGGAGGGLIGGGIKQLGSKNLATWLFSYLATLYISLIDG